ncbi:unnamed protein product [Meganyctiphanes norvegica]|uniref:Endonuclease/exonuclease/phosphatase domain-containing protein n=1 Tax=Meganyctiphanes norvegica TaxID=48144 RepID=A0AAV2QI69_MEGNR
MFITTNTNMILEIGDNIRLLNSPIKIELGKLELGKLTIIRQVLMTFSFLLTATGKATDDHISVSMPEATVTARSTNEIETSNLRQANATNSRIASEIMSTNDQRNSESNSKISRNRNNQLKCMNLNARSLTGKMEELREMVREIKPHIIGVTETWGKEEINDAYFKMENYILYRNDRVGKKGGGTMLYISNQLGQRECNTLNRPLNGISFDSSTWCWVSPTKGKKILVGSIYRSPNSSSVNDNHMLRQLELANNVAGRNRLLLMGDFNVPKINWATRDILPGARKIERDLYEAVTDNFLYQHVLLPTRYSGPSNSTLDLIFTKEEEDVKNVKVIQPVGSSDHGVVIGEFICKWKSRVVPRINKAYYKGDYDNISENLNQQVWPNEYSSTKPLGVCMQHYMANIKSLVNEHVPMGKTKDYNVPWMNDWNMRLWKKKQNAFSEIQRGSTGRKWTTYRTRRDKLRVSMRKARRLHEKKITKNLRI